MIETLISLIIVCIVFGLIYYLVTLLPIPAPFKRIIDIAFILIAILLLLGYLGGYVPHHAVIVR